MWWAGSRDTGEKTIKKSGFLLGATGGCDLLRAYHVPDPVLHQAGSGPSLPSPTPRTESAGQAGPSQLSGQQLQTHAPSLPSPDPQQFPACGPQAGTLI